MYNICCSVMPIFCVAFLGSVIRRKWLTSDEFWHSLEKLSFYVLFPAMLFSSISKSNIAPQELIKLVLALFVAMSIVATGLVLYQVRNNYDKVQFTSVFQGGTRYNNYIFFAVSAALFGDDGLTIVAAISPYTIFFTNSIAVLMFIFYGLAEENSKHNRRSLHFMFTSIITNPFIVASIVGFLFNYFEIEINKEMGKAINILADAALAVGVMIVGAGLRFRISRIHFNQAMFTSLVKLIIMPVITYCVLTMMSVAGLAKSIGVLFSALPCASSSYILSRQLGGDPETMSSIITFTTLFSIVSISTITYILG